MAGYVTANVLLSIKEYMHHMNFVVHTGMYDCLVPTFDYYDYIGLIENYMIHF
jgi:hypothetical protein